MKNTLSIRQMRASDNPQVAHIIRTVMPEFGCVGEGYSIDDPEVEAMFEAYDGDQSCFHIVINEQDEVIGCGGIAPLAGGDGTICELKKMYFLQEARGHGLGGQMIDLLVKEAKRLGFQQCYLETVTRMESANILYQKRGFKLLEGQMGCTGHSGCDSFYVLEL
ncbi:MAG: putative acetyltransferase [Saprospiraceae bacterium]|jgi:putative acetyltransferase